MELGFGVALGKAFATSGKSGRGVFFFAVAGLATGELKTGEIILGFGGSTISGFGISFFTTTRLTGAGFSGGGGG